MEQHHYKIAFAIKMAMLKLREKESSGTDDAPPEKAIIVLSCYIGDSLHNNLVREGQHHNGRDEEEVCQGVALLMAHKLYSNSHFASANVKYHMSL